jgi:hypothetical protein
VGLMLEDSLIDIHLLGELASGVLTDADRGELTWWIEARSKLRGGVDWDPCEIRREQEILGERGVVLLRVEGVGPNKKASH